MPPIIGTIITDCADDNARARQELRFKSLFGVTPTFLGVGAKDPDIEAAGNLLDQLGVLANLPASREGKQQKVLLVNVAPRGDKVRQKWSNGTPFCYCKVGDALVVSTYAGRNLSLLAERGLAESAGVLDIVGVTDAAVGWGEITQQQAERIRTTQFRSLEFLPLVAYWLASGRPVPSSPEVIEKHHDVRGKVWAIDNFGNAKTTLLPADVDFQEGKEVLLSDGEKAICYPRLADVPKDTTALVIGSSGYGTDRFLEVVVQWHDAGFHGSSKAAERHGLSVGSSVLAS